jgi:hypothetical protein
VLKTAFFNGRLRRSAEPSLEKKPLQTAKILVRENFACLHIYGLFEIFIDVWL